ncbi:hypothetical protein ONZ51_g13227 [Trametes cubensis]|uniref:Uncharacterized protein n=1 Tax=Trametes cubensis TaxID=1111947 RepID=A0AAD7TGX3_9APHY|nr:hypothetical protein ONZ51_g13227 [Trametes cubensis]
MCPAQVKFPESYTAYAFIKPGGKLERITVPWRFPEDGEIVVKVLACGRLLTMCVLRDGGYAEYVTLRSEAVVAVPRDMDPAEAAPMLCAGITTFNALRNMDVSPPDYVAVQGIG